MIEDRDQVTLTSSIGASGCIRCSGELIFRGRLALPRDEETIAAPRGRGGRGPNRALLLRESFDGTMVENPRRIAHANGDITRPRRGPSRITQRAAMLSSFGPMRRHCNPGR